MAPLDRVRHNYEWQKVQKASGMPTTSFIKHFFEKHSSAVTCQLKWDAFNNRSARSSEKHENRARGRKPSSRQGFQRYGPSEPVSTAAPGKTDP